MFQNALDFKQTFERRLSEKYGVGVKESHPVERYDVLGEMVRDYAGYDRRATEDKVKRGGKKQLIYFSMEFLIGKLLMNNMQNLGIYKVAKEGLAELGIDIRDLEAQEVDAGLGNGGLGRLAACFLDSIASLGYSGHGHCIRYEYGFFRQIIEHGRQFELPDQWLTNGFVFEVRKPQFAVEIKFGGNIETFLKEDGELGVRTVNFTAVKAMPYDISIVGYRNGVANTLRLWSAEPSETNLPKNVSFETYLTALKELSHGLYPDDSTEAGRLLRLRQQYFLVSAGVQSVFNEALERFGTLKDFDKHYVIQLNDTHPILAIPEMMRLLIDERGWGWDEAWDLVQRTIAYTNHTIMPEALERWPINYVQQVCPRCYMIIEEISRRFNAFLNERGTDGGAKYALAIIKDGMIHMTNLAIAAAFSVNGVARLHTRILETVTFKEFYALFPEKFNNKTNGVSHRRWLVNANRRLTALITSKIGRDWITDMEHEIGKLRMFADDAKLQREIMAVKRQNKLALAAFLKEKQGLVVDPDSIFDVQIKRLHAYKRQLMNVFRIIYLYQRIQEDPGFTMYPRTFIFGAKAAPSYVYAKKIIELILAVAEVVNNDPRASKFMKVAFVENYGVSLAELIIPAADVSEQISTASKEASGTSNMKLMMNGAITIGTLDGANIEIRQLAGPDNCVIFGLTSDQVLGYYRNGGYDPWEIYNGDPRVKKIMDSLFNGPWVGHKQDRFRLIFDEIMNNDDEFFILKDFDSYLKAQDRIEEFYKDKKRWARSVILNIAASGYFTSDRTVREYVRDVWHLDKVDPKSDED